MVGKLVQINNSLRTNHTHKHSLILVFEIMTGLQEPFDVYKNYVKCFLYFACCTQFYKQKGKTATIAPVLG